MRTQDDIWRRRGDPGPTKKIAHMRNARKLSGPKVAKTKHRKAVGPGSVCHLYPTDPTQSSLAIHTSLSFVFSNSSTISFLVEQQMRTDPCCVACDGYISFAHRLSFFRGIG
jgi:hypothetical protein